MIQVGPVNMTLCVTDLIQVLALSDVEFFTCKAPKKQTTKLSLQIFEKLSNINCILYSVIEDYSANTVDPD